MNAVTWPAFLPVLAVVLFVAVAVSERRAVRRECPDDRGCGQVSAGVALARITGTLSNRARITATSRAL